MKPDAKDIVKHIELNLELNYKLLKFKDEGSIRKMFNDIMDDCFKLFQLDVGDCISEKMTNCEIFLNFMSEINMNYWGENVQPIDIVAEL